MIDQDTVAELEELTQCIKDSYERGVTMDKAEKLAGKFLYAQVVVAEQLKLVELNARMKKSGVKAIKSAVYMEAATKTDKKPSDTLLEHHVNRDTLVQGAQNELDEAEIDTNTLERYYSIFREAHIFYRGISKQSFT